jgi:type II secretory pathway component GspD/PulD (secretin)
MAKGPGHPDHFVELGSDKVITGEQKFQGYYADKHVSALLTAMERNDYGRILAKPKILVNDNEPGLIKTAIHLC